MCDSCTLLLEACDEHASVGIGYCFHQIALSPELIDRLGIGSEPRHPVSSSDPPGASAKGRVTPFLVGIVGIFLGFLLNTYYLHLQTAKQLALMTLVSLGSSYAIWFLGALIVNTLRVPWFLDAESSELINIQENRTQIAENNLAEIRAARQKHGLFGRLMQQGVDFSCQIAECQTEAHFASWDRHSNEWIKSVQQAIRDMGFPPDAVEFVRAGDYAEPVKGIVNTGSKREERARVLEKHQENLADFVRRRLG